MSKWQSKGANQRSFTGVIQHGGNDIMILKAPAQFYLLLLLIPNRSFHSQCNHCYIDSCDFLVLCGCSEPKIEKEKSISKKKSEERKNCYSWNSHTHISGTASIIHQTGIDFIAPCTIPSVTCLAYAYALQRKDGRDDLSILSFRDEKVSTQDLLM